MHSPIVAAGPVPYRIWGLVVVFACLPRVEALLSLIRRDGWVTAVVLFLELTNWKNICSVFSQMKAGMCHQQICGWPFNRKKHGYPTVWPLATHKSQSDYCRNLGCELLR